MERPELAGLHGRFREWRPSFSKQSAWSGNWPEPLCEGSKTFGYDAQLDQYGDMLKAGVIDPTKVVRISLEYAASVAGLLVTTEAMVAEKPVKSGGQNMHDMESMGGMGGMM